MERLSVVFWRKKTALRARQLRKGRLLLSFGRRDGDEKLDFRDGIHFMLGMVELGALRLALTNPKGEVDFFHTPQGKGGVNKSLKGGWDKEGFTLRINEAGESNEKRGAIFSLSAGEAYVLARLVDKVIDDGLVEQRRSEAGSAHSGALQEDAEEPPVVEDDDDEHRIPLI